MEETGRLLQGSNEECGQNLEEEGWRQKKKVQIREDKNETAADTGGAIRKPVKEDVAIDVKRIEMEEPLMLEYEEEDEKEYLDEEAGTYSHMGGRLSGHGMAYDPPDVAESMIKSFQNHP